MQRFAILLFVVLLLFAVPVLSQQISDDFYVTVGSGVGLQGGGSGYNGGAWYVYPSMWINQWFYDHPFDPTRGKSVHVEFHWTAYDPTCTTDIAVAINWSTPEWSALGYGETLPPLPGELPSGIEEDYIVRLTVLDECDIYPEIQHFAYDYIIWDCNPERVSIDAMECNFEILDGDIVHECAMSTENSSWGAIKTMIE